MLKISNQRHLYFINQQSFKLYYQQPIQFTRNILMGRIQLFSVFLLTVLIILHRQKFSHNQTVFESIEGPTDVNAQITDHNNYYRTGVYDMSLAPVPKWNVKNPLGFLDLMSRKKINGFLFTQYNIYKMQVNFVDLFYSSLVQINFWSEDIGSIQVQEKIGISLSQDIDKAELNLQINKKHFNLTVRQLKRIGRDGQTQTVTSFNISLIQKHVDINGNYTHVRRDEQCMTAVREGVISHKCYGGYGYGKVRIEQIIYEENTKSYKKKLSAFNPKSNTTRCGFDGFRGSGWDWKWTWVYGQGFSKPQFYSKGQTIQKQRWIGFNFGALKNKSENFLFLNEKIYPILGAQYILDESFPTNKNITFTAQDPKIQMNFLVLDRTSHFQDLGILQNDMIKAEGHWRGYIMDPQNSTHKIEFYELSGLAETMNSVF